jgi:transforming growth factor-beta-induced protein
MKRTITLLLGLVAIVALAATAAIAAPAAKAKPKNIVQTAVGAKQFTTLVSLVKQAGLAGTLSKPGNYTVFAPTDKAFAKLERTNPDLFEKVTSDRALLRTVLTYHVLPRRVPATAALAAAQKEAKVKTVQGERIALSVRNNRIVLNGAARVILPDVKASNGIIHAIDTVIVPPSLLAPPAPTRNIVEIAVGNPQFSTLVALAQKANLVSVLSGGGPFTVFAPTNEAFEKLKAAAPATYDAVVNTPALLTKVLTYHAVAGSVQSAQAIEVAKQGGTVQTIAGESITLSLKDSKLTLNGSSTVITADILATNGVIHVIDTVIVPPSIAG